MSKIANRTKATHPAPSANSDKKISLVASSTFSGPVPPPELLHGYDAIIPGAAERILRMAEEDALHRREIEKSAIFHNSVEVKRGQNYGLIVSLAAFLSAVFCAAIGATTPATVIGGSTVLGLATAFIVGRSNKNP